MLLGIPSRIFKFLAITFEKDNINIVCTTLLYKSAISKQAKGVGTPF